jgi:hypothetical protein
MNCVLFNIVYEHIAATDEFSMRVELKLLAGRLLVKMSVLEAYRQRISANILRVNVGLYISE